MNSVSLKVAGIVGVSSAAIAGKIAISSSRNPIKSGKFREILKNGLNSLSTEEKCTSQKLIWDGGSCHLPKTIDGSISIGTEEKKDIKGNNDNERGNNCLEQRHYWWKDGSEKGCRTPNLTIMPRLRWPIGGWDSIENSQMQTSSGSAMEHMNGNGFWEIKRKDNNYAIVFKREKLNSLNDSLRGWEMPKHYSYGSNGVSMWDVCEKLKEISNNSPNAKLFLYDENKDTWWDCENKGFILFV